jgi:methionine aminotransferase
MTRNQRDASTAAAMAAGLSVSSKLPDVGTTIFTRMSAMAQAHAAINLSQGYPDYPISPELISLVEAALRAGHNQYAPMAGVMPLREQLAQKYESLYRRSYDPESEITITAGATQAIHSAIAALVSPGDEVIVFEPAYDSYAPSIRLQGGEVIRQPLAYPGFHIDWDALARAITPRTRMLILNSPNNPGTSVLTPEDLTALEKLVRGSNIVLLSDEVYEHMVYDGAPHQSLARSLELAGRSVIVASFGKTFHATGWKVGYALAPRELMQEFRRVHQFNVFCVNSVMQYALAQYLKEPAHYLGLSAFFQAKRDLFAQGLKATAFRPLHSAGSYFLLADYSRLSDAPDIAFVEELTRNHGVAAIPLSVFHHDACDRKFVRFCFAKQDETLYGALERLAAIR